MKVALYMLYHSKIEIFKGMTKKGEMLENTNIN